MQSNISKTKIIVCIFLMALFFLNCNKKTELENQITIVINSIDSETKLPRINKFDTIELRQEGVGYLMKTFDKVGEYVTDSLGSVKIKIDSNKTYHLILGGPNIFGSTDLIERHFKNGQKADIEVINLDKR